MAGKITKKAVWNGKTLAETNDFVLIEGNVYFPEESINKAYFKSSDTSTNCFWKGDASYYSIEVDGKENKDAAWFYPTPKDAAKEIKNRVAFWKGVEVVDA
jgi:uncharacterized protein (DUF427 family)